MRFSLAGSLAIAAAFLLATPARAGQHPPTACPYGYDRPGAQVPAGVQRPWGAAGGQACPAPGQAAAPSGERWFTLSATVAQSRQAFAVGFKHQACGATFGGQVGSDGHLKARLASKVWPAKYWLAYQGQAIGELWVEANGQVRFHGKQGFQLTGAIASFQ